MSTPAFSPAHPGEVLKGLYLDPLKITITNAAVNLGVSRRTLSMLINGRIGVSAEMALRLSEALDTTPEIWLDMQQSYDLWHAKQKRTTTSVKMIRKDDQNLILQN